MAELYDRYEKDGFTILAFPCNQFLGQEPGTNAEIKKFAQSRGARYNLFAKSDVNGENANSTYTWLKEVYPGDITWNFHQRFIIGRDGVPLRRFDKGASWEEVESEIKKALDVPAPSAAGEGEEKTAD
eukprot:111455_1